MIFFPKNIPPMLPNPLDILRKGLVCENLKINASIYLDEGTPDLAATYMIGKCISNINDPNTCRIEALLSQLNRKLQLEQTREFRNTTIIDFF